MNTEAVKQEITSILSTVKQPSRKQYPVAKHQIATLTELSLIELMPAGFGFTDAAAVISAAQDAGGKQIGEGDAATISNASKLYTLLQTAEKIEEIQPEKMVDLENAVLILGNLEGDYSRVAMQLIYRDGHNTFLTPVWRAKAMNGIAWLLESSPQIKDKKVEVYRVTKHQHSFFYRGTTTDYWNAAIKHYGLESLNR